MKACDGKSQGGNMREGLYARIQAFLDEFPFLARYVRIHRLDKRPMVQRIDLDLLDRCGRDKEALGGTLRFLLIDVAGEELIEVEPDHVSRIKFNIWHASTWFPCWVNGETVYEAIQRLNDPNKVKYVLEIEDAWGHCRRPNFDPDYGLRITLYKVPSGISFSEWLTQIRKIAMDELQGELGKLDKV